MDRFSLSDGREIRLSKKLGQGGEGSVFTSQDLQGFAIKVYSAPPSDDRASKIIGMCRLSDASINACCAWPQQPIFRGGTVHGFVMPLFSKAFEIHELYGVKSRKRHFPEATWKFLVHAARNLAAAVHTVHRSGAVLGDFNQRNTVVFADGRVSFWDCDSFQVTLGGKTHLCPVGVPEFTPPELQKVNDFSTQVRTFEHDYFALAVLIFKLLFLGRHPFSGNLLRDPGNAFDIQAAIEQKKFAYSIQSPQLGISPPKTSPPVTALSGDIANLFEAAFLGRNRPAAKDWYETLDGTYASLISCDRSASHWFPKRLTYCPWCKYETELNILVFVPPKGAVRSDFVFDIDRYIAGFGELFRALSVDIPNETARLIGTPLPPIATIPIDVSDRFQKAKQSLQSIEKSLGHYKLGFKKNPQIEKVIQEGRVANQSLGMLNQRIQNLNTHKQQLELCCNKLCARLAIIDGLRDGNSPSDKNSDSREKKAQQGPFRRFFHYMAIRSPLADIYLRSLERHEFQQRHSLHNYATELDDLNSQLTIAKSQLVSTQQLLVNLSQELHRLRAEDAEREQAWLAAIEKLESQLDTARQFFLNASNEYQQASAIADYHNSGRAEQINERRRKLNDLRQKRDSKINFVQRLASGQTLKAAREKVKTCARNLRNLQVHYENELQDLKANAYYLQRERYLESYSVEQFKSNIIHRSLIIALQSNGIQTAADIDESVIMDINGFGPKRTYALLKWREELEKNFGFDPSLPIDPDELCRLQDRYASQFHANENNLKAAIEDLAQDYKQAKIKIATVVEQIDFLNQTIAQAKADVEIAVST